jgi:hypothetical protein
MDRLTRLLCLFGVLGMGAMDAATIQYRLTHLGASSYEYEYLLSADIQLEAGTSFLDTQFVSIYFPVAEYGAVAPIPPPASTLTATFGVDPVAVNVVDSFGGLPHAYQILAGITHPDLTAFSFRVAFEWFGIGTPGLQAFELFDRDGVTAIDSGFTTEATDVPEPSTWFAGSIALAAAAVAHLRRRNLTY